MRYDREIAVIQTEIMVLFEISFWNTVRNFSNTAFVQLQATQLLWQPVIQTMELARFWPLDRF